MNNPFENDNANPVPVTAEEKKKKLWKNMFVINLCVTLLLIGLFWLPPKLVSVNEFLDSPSVNLPKRGEVADAALEQAPVVPAGNLLDTHYVVVNASSENDWAYFSLAKGAPVKIHDQTSLKWDLAFRRGKVISNGGATNKIGNAGLIDLGDVPYDSVVEVPDGNYIADEATRTETHSPVLLKWYKYNYLTHKLSAKKNVYAMRTADNKYAKIQFLGFTCENQETGCIKLRYTYQDNGGTSFLLGSAGEKTPAVAANPEPGKI